MIEYVPSGESAEKITSDDFNITFKESPSHTDTGDLLNRREALRTLAGLGVAFAFPMFHASESAHARTGNKKEVAAPAISPNMSEVPPKREGVLRPISTWTVEYLHGFVGADGSKKKGFLAGLKTARDADDVTKIMMSMRRILPQGASFLPDVESHWLYGRYSKELFTRDDMGNHPWPTMSMILKNVKSTSKTEGEASTRDMPYSAFAVKTARGSRTCVPTPVMMVKAKASTGAVDVAFEKEMHDGRLSLLVDAQHPGKNADATALTITQLRSSELEKQGWGSIPFFGTKTNSKGVLDGRLRTTIGGPIVDFSENPKLFNHLKEVISKRYPEPKARENILAALRHSNLMLVMSEDLNWNKIREGLFDGIFGAPAFLSTKPESNDVPGVEVVGQAQIPLLLTDFDPRVWGVLLTKPEALREAVKISESSL